MTTWLRQKYKKIATSLGVGFLMFALVTPIASASIDNAFSSLLAGANTSIQKGGRFESQTRNIYTFGGARIRFPRSSVQLISITPPSFQAGCGGIDVFFGGFSFINGEQFQQLLRNIGQAAIGYAVLLAIKQLCPQCEAVLEALQKAAQLASKLAIDSCAAGEALVKAAAGKLGVNPGGQTEACGKKVAARNESDGFLSGINNMCNTMDKWSSKLDEITRGSKQERNEAAEIFGNQTWIALDNLGFAKDPYIGELFLSMLGTVVTSVTDQTGTFYPPIESSDVLTLFICGSRRDYPVENNIAQGYCGKLPLDAEVIILSCNGEYINCISPNEMFMHEWPGLATLGYGFIAKVETVLKKAISNVRSRSPQGIGAEGMGLIQAAPLPLYKAINIAAVYPDVAEELIAQNTVILAHMLAQEFLRNIIAESMKNSQKRTGVPPGIMVGIIELVNKLNRDTHSEAQKVNAMLVHQESLIGQIKAVNSVMQETLFSRGLGANALFSQNVMSSFSGAGKVVPDAYSSHHPQ